MTESPKFCKDCIHCEQLKWMGKPHGKPICARTRGKPEPDLVTGEVGIKFDGFYCEVERMSIDLDKQCGPSAKYFEPREARRES